MKFTLGVLLGATVTAIIIHYLNTEEGKALVDKVKKDAEEVSDNLSELAENLVEKGKSIIGKEGSEIETAGETIVVLV